MGAQGHAHTVREVNTVLYDPYPTTDPLIVVLSLCLFLLLLLSPISPTTGPDVSFGYAMIYAKSIPWLT